VVCTLLINGSVSTTQQMLIQYLCYDVAAVGARVRNSVLLQLDVIIHQEHLVKVLAAPKQQHRVDLVT
jgi:hypothetical protein